LAAAWQEQKEGLLDAGQTAALKRRTALFEKQQQEHNQRFDHLKKMGDRVGKVQQQYEKTPLHSGLMYSEEEDRKNASLGSEFLRHVKNDPLFNFVNQFPNWKAGSEKLKEARANLMARGEYPPLPALPSQKAGEKERYTKEKNDLLAMMIRKITVAKMQPGGANAREVLLTPPSINLTSWQKKIYPAVAQSVLGELKAQKMAGVPLGLAVDLILIPITAGFGAFGSKLSSKFVGRALGMYLTEPVTAILSKQGVGAALKYGAAQGTAHVLGGATASIAAGTTGSAGSVLLTGGTPQEAVQAAKQSVGPAAVIGAIFGGLSFSKHLAESPHWKGYTPEQAAAMAERGAAQARSMGMTADQVQHVRQGLTEFATAPAWRRYKLGKSLSEYVASVNAKDVTPPPQKALPAAGGGQKPTAAPAKPKPSPGPRINTPEGEVDLRTLAPEQLQQIGVAAAEAGDQATATKAEQWIAQHDVRQQARSTRIPDGSEQAYLQEWNNPKNLHRQQHDTLNAAAAAVAETNPALAEKLKAAAGEAQMDMIEKFRVEQPQDLAGGDALAAVPPPLASTWRQLSPSERVDVPNRARAALLIQDISNSLSVLTPAQPPISAISDVPGKPKTITALQDVADQLYADAQSQWDTLYPSQEAPVTPTPTEAAPPPPVEAPAADLAADVPVPVTDAAAAVPGAAPEGVGVAAAAPTPEVPPEQAQLPSAPVTAEAPIASDKRAAEVLSQQQANAAAAAAKGRGPRRPQPKPPNLGIEGATLTPEPVAAEDMGYAGPERRADTGTRRRLDEITDIEDARTEIARARAEADEAGALAYTDPLTSLRNRNGFLREVDEADGNFTPKGGKLMAVVDADGLSYVNEKYTHLGGDRLLQALGDSVRKAGLEANSYRLGGDEIAVLGDNEADLAAKMQLLRDIQEQAEVTVEVTDEATGAVEQVTHKGFSLSYGVGKDYKTADAALFTEKETRTKAGLRAAEKGAAAGERARPPQLVEVRREGGAPTPVADRGRKTSVRRVDSPAKEGVGSGVAASKRRTPAKPTAKEPLVPVKIEPKADDGLSGRKGGSASSLPPGAGGSEGQPPKPPAVPTPGAPKDKPVKRSGSGWGEIDDQGLRAKVAENSAVPGPNFKEKLQTALTRMRHGLTRNFEDLPRTAEWSEINLHLTRLQKAKDIAEAETAFNLYEALDGLNPKQYKTFSDALLFRDMAQDIISQRDRFLNAGGDPENWSGPVLPDGFTEESVARQNALFNQDLDFGSVDANRRPEGETPQQTISRIRVNTAFDRLKEIRKIKDTYLDNFEAVSGRRPEMNREDYFRHKMIAYRLGKMAASGKGLGFPGSPGFLKERRGSMLAYDMDMITAEMDWMPDMIRDNMVLEFLKLVQKTKDINPRLQTELKADPTKTLKDVIPEGYVVWHGLPGSVFQNAFSVPEQVATQIEVHLGEAFGIPKDLMDELLQSTERGRQMVIPKPLADTLNRIGRSHPDSFEYWALRGLRYAMTGWKMYTLLNPYHAVPYFMMNGISDMQAIGRTRPQAVRKVGQAAGDLRKAMVDPLIGKRSAIPEELREWMSRGGLPSLLNASEDLGSFKGVDLLGRFAVRGKPLPAKLVNGLMTVVRLPHDYREAVGRYAVYLDVLDEIKKNGRPLSFGGSIAEEVLALSDPRDQAYKIANDIVGAYDEVTEAGQFMRRYVSPFWSWQEVNPKREKRMVVNAARDRLYANAWDNPLMQLAAGEKIGGKGQGWMRAMRLGRYALNALGIALTTAAFNKLFFPEAEQDVPKDARGRPHLITSYDPKTKNATYYNRLDNLADALSMFELDNFMGYREDYLNGRMSLGEILFQMGPKGATNKLYQALGPQYKMPVELLTGTKTFPNVWESRKVNDRWEQFFGTFKLNSIYRQIQGLPDHKGTTRIAGMEVPTYALGGGQRVDIGESAYSEMKRQASLWNQKRGRKPGMGGDTPKSVALMYHKQAMRSEDREAAARFLVDYIIAAAGEGIPKDKMEENYRVSLKTLDPLHMLKEADQKKFIAQLSPGDVARLKRAYQYYQELVAGDLPERDMAGRSDWGFVSSTQRRVEGRLDRAAPIRKAFRETPGLRERAKELQKLAK
jgi:diguanylate cyclase (GGDEF)-like protein